jgi:hypothetical protein
VPHTAKNKDTKLSVADACMILKFEAVPQINRTAFLFIPKPAEHISFVILSSCQIQNEKTDSHRLYSSFC